MTQKMRWAGKMRAQIGGVSFWVEPEEQLVSIFLIQEPGAGLRPDFESAVRQAIID